MPPQAMNADPQPVDRRALTIVQRYLDSKTVHHGGRTVAPPEPAEISYARSAGYFFDPVELTHDELINRLHAVRSKLTTRCAADTFVAGLGRQRPDWRSAIASLAVASHLPAHVPDFSREYWPCRVCGIWPGPSRNVAEKIRFHPNDVLLGRFAIGGGGFSQETPAYATFDLEQFVALPAKPQPTSDDVTALRSLIDMLHAAPRSATPSKLVDLIARGGGGNRYQRQQTIETLAMIGVLEPKAWPSFWRTYTPYVDRPEPSGRSDWAFPALAWHGSDGVNDEAVQFWFGHLLNGASP